MKDYLNRTLFMGLTSLSLLVAPTLFANELKFDYRQVDKVMTIEGELCSYGRASKSALPEKIKQHVQQYVQQNTPAFVKQIKNVQKGMAGHRLTVAEMAVLYSFDINKTAIDYSFSGNDVCAEYKTELSLDFEQDFSEYIESTNVSDFYFVAASNAPAEVEQILMQRFAIKDSKNLANHVEVVQPTSSGFSLYKFALETFKQHQALDKKMVFVKGTSINKLGLTDYLSKSGYTVVDSADSSFWQVDITQTRYPHFELAINNADNVSESIDSTRFPVPPFPTNTEIEKRKLLQFQLTMMKLADKLK